MQQGPGDFHAAAMTSIEPADTFVPSIPELQALQFLLCPGLHVSGRHSLNRPVILQVLQNREIEVKGGLLKYNPEGC